MIVRTTILEIILTISFWGYPSSSQGIPGELSKQKCKEYTAYVNSSECPFSNSELVLGSSFAKDGEFPYMVIIGYDEDGTTEWLSAGALISEDFVLTTANSLIRKNPKIVRVGVTDLSNTEDFQEIKIKKAIIHPNFIKESAYNDIGLLKLDKKVNITRNTRPACLFTEAEIGVERATHSSWNKTKTNEKVEFKLFKVNMDIIDERQCNDSYANRIILSRIITYNTQICAGTKSIEIKRPEAGGPLLKPHKDEEGRFQCIYDIIGVASFGTPKLTKENPDVFTRVSAYIPWIEENVWK